MPKPEEHQISVRVQFDETVAFETAYFNCFNVEALDNQLLLEFGATKGRTLISYTRCILSSEAIKTSVDAMRVFLESIPEEYHGEKGLPMPPPAIANTERVALVNFIHASRYGEIGELRLGAFSYGHLIEGSRTQKKTQKIFHAKPILVLHCGLKTLIEVLSMIYLGEYAPDA
jgi:hypothetical protein